MDNQRLLPIKNGHNFRELGGYQTSDGHTLKWGRLIRSGSLNQLSASDERVLTQIPVKVDIDFRSKPEVNAAPDRVPVTAHYFGLPVLNVDETESSQSDQEIAKEMQVAGNGFRHMLTVYEKIAQLPSARHAYQEMFRLLLATSQGAVLFHCTAGKDRTGFGAFLILTALGVPRETIMADYLLTNDATATFRKQWLKGLQNNSDHQLGNVNAVINNRQDLIMVHQEYLERACQVIKRLAGSPKNYLTDYLGLTNKDLQDLRRLYLD